MVIAGAAVLGTMSLIGLARLLMGNVHPSANPLFHSWIVDERGGRWIPVYVADTGGNRIFLDKIRRIAVFVKSMSLENPLKSWSESRADFVNGSQIVPVTANDEIVLIGEHETIRLAYHESGATFDEIESALHGWLGKDRLIERISLCFRGDRQKLLADLK
jgi:hypothetical protein